MPTNKTPLEQLVGKKNLEGKALANPQLVNNNRSLILWEVPHVGNKQYIEMYLNPQNLSFTSNKIISETQTKGGFMLQYWGENLDTINIQGTTGSGGIEAMNVLRDVYRSEQLALINITKTRFNTPGRTGNQVGRRQSLAQLASSVVMWYQGQGFRGYFTNMSYQETAAAYSFTYSMDFKVTDIIGNPRRNYMPWHRRPWSTSEKPSSINGEVITGGAYDTDIKIGELNAPSIGRYFVKDIIEPGKDGKEPTTTRVIIPISNKFADTKVDRVQADTSTTALQARDISYSSLGDKALTSDPIGKSKIRVLK